MILMKKKFKNYNVSRSKLWKKKGKDEDCNKIIN